MTLFHIGTVLTVTSGVLLCNIDELYKILGYLTQTSLYTHQLPRAANCAKPYILGKYPELQIDIPEVTNEKEVNAFLENLISLGFRKEYELEPLTDFVPIDPISELIEIRGGTDGIIVVEAD